jgi:tripartite ATP-independent transporter DctP family solute receptor
MTAVIRQLATAAALLGLALAAGAQEKIRVAGNFATEHSSSVAMEQVFKPELAKLSRNQLGVDIFPAMQLGGAKENVDAVRSGALFMTWVGVAFLSRIVPELEAISLPFLMPSREVAFKVIDGEVGQLIDRRYADKGFISLGWMELGSRQVTNSKRPIQTIDDFKGLKIRMQPLETHLATFRALGANPVAMDIKELYSAMQQGVVDGQENPFAIIQANRYFEVQKFVSNTGHFYDFIAIVANRRQLEAMKPEQQEAIRGAMTAAVAHQRKIAAELDAKAVEELKKRMQYNDVSPQVREQMRKASAGVVDQVKSRIGAELVNRVLAEVAKAR